MVRKYFEILMIWIAKSILIGRNLNRCKVVSRRDNNDMWYMAEKLDSIMKRMRHEYNEQ